MSTTAAALLVRDGLGDDALAALQGEVTENVWRIVGTLYDAVLDAAGPRNERSVTAVLMAPPTADLDEQQVVEALRRADPSLRLIMVLDDEDPEHNSTCTERAFAAGFDDVIGLPVTPPRLREALGNTNSRPVSTAPREDLERPAETRSIVEVVLETSRVHAFLEGRAPTDALVGPIPPINEPGGAGPLDCAPLLQAILEGAPLEELATEIIARHSGIQDLEFTVFEPAFASNDDSADPLVTHEGRVVIPVPAPGGVFGFLACAEGPEASIHTLAPWARWLARWLLVDRQHSDLRRMAWTDDLTGAGNRRALGHIIERVISRARENRHAVTIMCFDIDNFKTYNDRFGHDAGDQVLCETVQLLHSVIRRGDHVFRVGGDEFVVVFADESAPRSARSGPPESIGQIAERFQQRISELHLTQIGMEAPGTLSVSAGMVTYPWDGSTPDELLRRADQLALESKRNGKNVITFGPADRERPPS